MSHNGLPVRARERANPLRVGVLASGRGSNLGAIIDASETGRIGAEVICVVSDKAAAPVLERARARRIETVALPADQFPGRRAYHDALLEALDAHGVELVALAGYMRRIPARIVQRYRWRMMNVHPSLLPAFPGLDAQRQALEHGAKIAGCTVHFVDEGLDSGPIILQAAVPVRDDDTVTSLSERILEEEHRIYPEAIRLYAEGLLHVRERRIYVRGETEVNAEREPISREGEL